MIAGFTNIQGLPEYRAYNVISRLAGESAAFVCMNSLEAPSALNCYSDRYGKGRGS